MNDNVLLVFPAFTNKEKAQRPPLGLLSIATMLFEKGIKATILDETVETNFDSKLLNELKNNPICVGISSMSVNHIMPSLRVSKLVKDNSDIPTVWGGIHPSLAPERTLENDLVDIIVKDDGEEAFTKLLVSLNQNRSDIDKIPGIGFKKNGTIIFNEPPLPFNLEKRMPFAFSLIDFRKYRPAGFWKHVLDLKSDDSIIPMETSRGCPFSCTFCTESMRKKKWQALPAKRVVSDIKFYIKTYGIRNFTFNDDNFFADTKRGEDIVNLLIKENLGIKWYTNIRPDYLAKTSNIFIKKLEESGCRFLTFGAESGSERILKDINKKTSVDDLITTNRKLAGSKITPSFFTIRGFPGETKEDLIKTYLLMIQLKQENNNAYLPSALLLPTPCTKIAEVCLGKKIHQFSLKDWSELLNTQRITKDPWILDDTYNFIQKNKAFLAIIDRLNTPSVFAKPLYRLLLQVYKLGFIYGFSERLGSIIQTTYNIIKIIQRPLLKTTAHLKE